MAFVVADRVRENTLTTGTGAVTLTGAVTGFQSFAAIGNTNTTYYTIAHQTLTEWETGIGTYTSAGTILTRTTVISSSNGGSAVNFSAGTKDVFVSPPASTYAPVTGQALYTGAGSYSWTVPTNVTSVCVVCIGAGAGGYPSYGTSQNAGGGLAYKNNIVVVPGAVWTVNVGLAGDPAANNFGGDSSFVSPASVTACRAQGGQGSTGGSGGTTLGYDGGGNGGNGDFLGGGGAGGYSGNGGARSTSAAVGSGGGSGGGGYSSTYGNSGGGGVGPYGQGTTGVYSNYRGVGGSGGESSNIKENPSYTYGNVTSPGGDYGGGGGASGTNSIAGGIGSTRGGRGCVRIIWGPGRSFPSTGTGDM